MYARKIIGPRSEPCGTPEETQITLYHNSLFMIIQKAFNSLNSVSSDVKVRKFQEKFFTEHFIKSFAKVQKNIKK